MKAAVLYEINTPLKIEEFDLPGYRTQSGPGANRRQRGLPFRLARCQGRLAPHPDTDHLGSRGSGCCRRGGNASYRG